MRRNEVIKGRSPTLISISREKGMLGEKGWSGKRDGRGKKMVGETAHNLLFTLFLSSILTIQFVNW
uniref:Transmembrane protein n=1 Tax=Romanomermis culicivorax TaxID=13658 RepID=A0A915J7A8_ROMCU